MLLTKVAAVVGLSLLLSGCSVAALMQTDNIEKRLLALEGRVHEIEVRQSAALTVTPSSSVPGRSR